MAEVNKTSESIIHNSPTKKLPVTDTGDGFNTVIKNIFERQKGLAVGLNTPFGQVYVTPKKLEELIQNSCIGNNGSLIV
jgi:hypothetical protein